MAGANGSRNIRMGKPLHRLSSGDLISLDSPKTSVCPTGVLIDMSDAAVQLPYPKELLRVGEFDDTFGIFNYSSTNATASSGHPGVNLSRRHSMPRNSTNNGQLARLFSIEEAMDIGSAENLLVTSSPVCQRSPPPARRSLGNQNQNHRTPQTLSDSVDSLLDVDNLSTFSFSDSEELLDELRKNDIDDSWGTSPITMAKEIEEIVRAERACTSTVTMPPSNEDPIPTYSRNRDSLSSKLQRLSMLLNSPGPSPPPPAQKKMQAVETSVASPIIVAQPTRRVSISISTMTSPMSKVNLASTSPLSINRGQAGSSTATGIQTSSSKIIGTRTPISKFAKPRIPPFSYTPISSQKSPTKFIEDTHGGYTVSPTESIDSTMSTISHCSSTTKTMAFKRLSFSSISSSSTSPTKSMKNEPIFGIRKATVGGGATRGGFHPSSIRPASLRIGGRSSIQPLKATAPIPPVVPPSAGGYSGNVSVISNNDMTRNRKTSGRPVCASAPVTRKFIPPVAASSPHTINHVFTTPTRKSFTNIRSSGYGQQSPCTSAYKISAASPVSKYIPTPTALPSPKPIIRQVMGVRGQIPEMEKPIVSVNHKPVQKTEPSGTRIRRSSMVSKENKPKMNSFVPRTGYGFTRPIN